MLCIFRDVTHRRKRLRSSDSDAPSAKKRLLRAEEPVPSTSYAEPAQHPPPFIRKCKELMDSSNSSHTDNVTSQSDVSGSVFSQDDPLAMSCFKQDYGSDDVFYDESDERCSSSAIAKPANAPHFNDPSTSTYVPLLAIASPVSYYPHYPSSIGFSVQPPPFQPTPAAHAITNTLNAHPSVIPHPSATSLTSGFGTHSHVAPPVDSAAVNQPLPLPSAGFASTSTVSAHPPLITYPSSSSHLPPPPTPITQEEDYALKIASAVLCKEAFPPGLLASDDSQSLPASPPPSSSSDQKERRLSE